MTYTEFPTDRIIDVHFKKKPDDKPPSPCQPGQSEFCNTYQYGVTAGHAPNGQIAAIPDQTAVAPFAGTWKTVGLNGPPPGQWGALQAAPGLPDGIPDSIAATGYGQDAESLFVGSAGDSSNITFTNQQLQALSVASGPGYNIRWIVLMSFGEALFDPSDIFSNCVGYIVDTYTFDIEWSSSSDVTHGIGITHLSNNPNFNPPIIPPPEPVVVFTGASGSWKYKIDWINWFFGVFLIDAGNQFSDSVGGPILIWWMTFDGGSGQWRASTNFMGNTIGALGDSYHWKLSATCMAENAPDFPPMKQSP